MTISARILLDSAYNGARLTTFELTYPRIIHAERMTHRQESKNAASSRAIPIERMIGAVLGNPFIPIRWGANGKGMQDHGILPPSIAAEAERVWLEARDAAVQAAEKLEALGVHKQISNRVLEPFSHITVICSSTQWGNMYHLRRDKAAQPEFKALADLMWDTYHASKPEPVRDRNYWHTPLVSSAERREILELTRDEIGGIGPESYSAAVEKICKISVGRCARVSYLTHLGTRDFAADIALHDSLMSSGHWSPFEHVARPAEYSGDQSGNYRGWTQYRKVIPLEHPFYTHDGGLRYDPPAPLTVPPLDPSSGREWEGYRNFMSADAAHRT